MLCYLYIAFYGLKGSKVIGYRGCNYARSIKVPTPRWSAYDALRFAIVMALEVPMTHHERAWT